MTGANTLCEGGFTANPFFKIQPMDAIFDDLSSALRKPHSDAWDKIRAIAIDAAGKFFTGIAIGMGFAIVHAVAG